MEKTFTQIAYALLAGAFLLYLLYRNRRAAARKLARYKRADAVILEKWVMAASDEHTGSPVPSSYCLKYEFRNHLGEKLTHTVKMSAPTEGWDALAPGDKIRIAYDPKSGSESYPVSYLKYVEGDKPPLGLILFMVIVLIGMYMLNPFGFIDF